MTRSGAATGFSFVACTTIGKSPCASAIPIGSVLLGIERLTSVWG